MGLLPVQPRPPARVEVGAPPPHDDSLTQAPPNCGKDRRRELRARGSRPDFGTGRSRRWPMEPAANPLESIASGGARVAPGLQGRPQVNVLAHPRPAPHPKPDAADVNR